MIVLIIHYCTFFTYETGCVKAGEARGRKARIFMRPCEVTDLEEVPGLVCMPLRRNDEGGPSKKRVIS